MNELLEHFAAMGVSVELQRLNPLQLAYLGDALFDVYVRSYWVMTIPRADGSAPQTYGPVGVRRGPVPARWMHCGTRSRTRNGNGCAAGATPHPSTTAKNASVADYRKATGFECLLGFLYISGRGERLMEVLRLWAQHREE